jgi:hypothetical protein
MFQTEVIDLELLGFWLLSIVRYSEEHSVSETGWDGSISSDGG